MCCSKLNLLTTEIGNQSLSLSILQRSLQNREIKISVTLSKKKKIEDKKIKNRILMFSDLITKE